MNVDAEVFGPYRLDELLGRGGMGEVYRAYDLEFERTVAVKRLSAHLADDPRFQERFRREAHHVARLRNPHIVPIHRYGEINGQLYIDMRYVEGGDLADLIRTTGPLPPDRAVRILEHLASALDDAHANGLVHRDVKPSNALLDRRVADFCYLADFGITRLATDRRSNSLTRTGALLGSLAYMAPEQFDGMVTMQSDIYSLTCVFYEMLTGARPYEGDALPVLMHAHIQGGRAPTVGTQPGGRGVRRGRRDRDGEGGDGPFHLRGRARRGRPRGAGGPCRAVLRRRRTDPPRTRAPHPGGHNGGRHARGEQDTRRLRRLGRRRETGRRHPRGESWFSPR